MSDVSIAEVAAWNACRAMYIRSLWTVLGISGARGSGARTLSLKQTSGRCWQVLPLTVKLCSKFTRSCVRSTMGRTYVKFYVARVKLPRVLHVYNWKERTVALQMLHGRGMASRIRWVLSLGPPMLVRLVRDALLSFGKRQDATTYSAGAARASVTVVVRRWAGTPQKASHAFAVKHAMRLACGDSAAGCRSTHSLRLDVLFAGWCTAPHATCPRRALPMPFA